MGLTIGIQFLTGYCVAARNKSDPRPEWPPHPARIYMALAAAHFECESGNAEQAALQWLASLEAPTLQVPAEVTMANAVPTFVPLNDTKSVRTGGGIQGLPSLKRHRADRLFPRTRLPDDSDTIYLTWADATANEIARHRPALENLSAHVARIGHSSSLVYVWITDKPAPGLTTLAPDERTGQPMRVVAKDVGMLDRLRTFHEVPPYRPIIATSRGYSLVKEAASTASVTVFDPRVEVFRLTPESSHHHRMALETTLALTRTLRDAILKRCSEPIPGSISGHTSDGSPTKDPHVAIVPLPFVGAPHADGHLLGVGVVLPHGMDRREVDQLVAALDAIADDEDRDRRGTGIGFDSQRFPGLGQWRLIRQGLFESIKQSLRLDTWTAGSDGSRRWASVTPVVFDQHAKSRSKATYLEECSVQIADATTRVVTEAQVIEVRVMPVSPFLGVPPARDFPRLQRKDGSERRHTHIEIVFDRPIVGPLIIGAGRFRGYGLCRPLREEDAA